MTQDDSGDDEPQFTNAERAEWGEAALRRHQNEAEETDDDPRSVSYLLRDLMHLADQYGWDFQALIEVASYFYRQDAGRGDDPPGFDLKELMRKTKSGASITVIRPLG